MPNSWPPPPPRPATPATLFPYTPQMIAQEGHGGCYGRATHPCFEENPKPEKKKIHHCNDVLQQHSSNKFKRPRYSVSTISQMTTLDERNLVDKSTPVMHSLECEASSQVTGSSKETNPGASNSSHTSSGNGIQHTGVPVISNTKLHKKCHPSEAYWKGNFHVTGTLSHNIAGVEAHFPSEICARVYKASKQMPHILNLEAVPLSQLWQTQIEMKTLDVQDIDIAFINSHQRPCKSYKCLLDKISSHTGLRTDVGETELVLFSSKLLSPPYQKNNGEFYFWGTFGECVRKNQRPLNCHYKKMKISYPNERHGHFCSKSENTEMEINVTEERGRDNRGMECKFKDGNQGHGRKREGQQPLTGTTKRAKMSSSRDYGKLMQVFVNLCGTLSMQVDPETTTVRNLISLALQRRRIRKDVDVYLLYCGIPLDDASLLSVLQIPRDATLAIIPRFRAGQDNCLIHPRTFVVFAKDIRPFYKVIIPQALRKSSATNEVYIIFLSQAARYLVHMMVVCISRLHAEGKSMAGNFCCNDFLFWNGCALFRPDPTRPDAEIQNKILDYRMLSNIIEKMFSRPMLQPDDDLPAYVAHLVHTLRVFVHLGDPSTLRAYASNHMALVCFTERIKKILEMERFHHFLKFAFKGDFSNAVKDLGGWVAEITEVQLIHNTYMHKSTKGISRFTQNGVDWMEVGRNFLSHPTGKNAGPKKSCTQDVPFTEEEAEAALSLYWKDRLARFLLNIVTYFEFPQGIDKKLICGNEITDPDARGGESGGEEFSI